MDAQVQFCMLNHWKKCFYPKFNHFHDFWMMSEMQAKVGLLVSWRVQWRKVLSLMRCTLSWIEKCWSEWEVMFLKHESVSHLKILFCERKLAQSDVRSSFLKRNVFVLSHSNSYLTPQMTMSPMRFKGSKFGVNMHAWGEG